MELRPAILCCAVCCLALHTFLVLFCDVYEGCPYNHRTNSLNLQPLVADHTTIPHMKAMDVPFHLMYDTRFFDESGTA